VLRSAALFGSHAAGWLAARFWGLTRSGPTDLCCQPGSPVRTGSWGHSSVRTLARSWSGSAATGSGSRTSDTPGRSRCRSPRHSARCAERAQRQGRGSEDFNHR